MSAQSTVLAISTACTKISGKNLFIADFQTYPNWQRNIYMHINILDCINILDLLRCRLLSHKINTYFERYLIVFINP